MNKCEHGKTIVKFCMFEHCQSKQTAGCEDCIRKHHNHIGQISFLTQDDIKNIVKKFQIEANYRPKSRPLQECIFNFFTHVKTNISLNLDLACKNFINEIGYPYLQKNGTLSCYKRLKNKEYRKVTQKELRQLWQVYKVVDYNDIIKQEKTIYSEAVVRMQEMIDGLQKNVKEMLQKLTAMVMTNKSNAGLYDRTYYVKINDIFKQIKKYPDINFPKTQIPRPLEKQIEKGGESPTRQKKLQRDARDVSLDRHVKLQSRLKTQQIYKIQDQIVSPHQNKPKPTDQKYSNDVENEQKQKDKDKVRKAPKYSAQIRPEDLVIRQNPKIQASLDYSEKEQEINERKKKLMELMNSKSSKRVDLPQTKNLTLTPMREKSHSNRLQVPNYVKESLTTDRNLGKDFSTPSNPAKNSTLQYSFKNSVNSNQQSTTSKRLKTAFFEDEEEHPENKKQTRNQTGMSSQTQTESLFNAKIHIPIEDHKHQDDFQIKEESVQKCIVVPVAPQIDAIARQIFDMANECQSPLLMKKKQIQNFSAFIKLAESKFFQQKQQTQPEHQPPTKGKEDQEKSFVKLNKVLEDSDLKIESINPKVQTKAQVKTEKQESQSPKLKGTQKEQDSVQINDSEQMSLALLLKSLKLSGSQAIPYLEKAIEHSSSNLSAAEYLSYLYLQTEKPQECLKLCNDILKLISSSQSNPLALRLNINKSAALNYLGRYSECITFLERCLRHKHNDILYKNLADAYYSIGILEKAIYNYEHAIIENSSNTEAHYNLAVCHYQQQNYYNASIYIDKALKHNPNNEVYKEIKKYNDEKILSNAN